MQVLVTGVAGFVGSHLAEALLAQGDEVVGVDSFTSYYNLQQKRDNLRSLLNSRGFQFVEIDLRSAPLQEFVDGVDVIFHQAAQPGVRSSWGAFESYVQHNLLVTQRVLDAARAAQVRKVVYASSSSIYGNTSHYPTREDEIPRPHSPYGVTKLAAEHLVRLYGQNWGLPTVALRYFTVYGPRQRPDMAMHRLVESAFSGRRFALYGTGSQVRDFTYVSDVVAANLRAVETDVPPGAVFNIAGGGSTSMAALIDLVGELSGGQVNVERLPEQAGDVARTGGDTSAAEALLAWRPVVSIREGLKAQIAWHRGVVGRQAF
jgi:UDP-glucuronate 4-epimerase